MKRPLLLITAPLLLAVATAAYADDLHPPNWRGNPGTSWAAWEFLQDNRTPPPDAGYLPFGPPTLVWTPGPGADWLPQKPPYDPPGMSGDGWANLSGDIDLTMPNSPELNPFKQVWIQLTWSPQVVGNVPFLQVFSPFQTTPEFSTPLVQTTLFEEYPGEPNGVKVYHSVYHVDLQPNPPWERIHIRGGIDVDELIVDTWCVPEPASLLMLTLGTLLVNRRR